MDEHYTPEEIERLYKKYGPPPFYPEPGQATDTEEVDHGRTDPHLLAAPPRTTPHLGRTEPHLARTDPHQPAPVDLIDANALPPNRRGDHSPLDDISPQNQAILLQLLESGRSHEKVAEFISAPRPEGLGIPTTKRSVIRFEQRHRRKQAKAIAQANEAAAADVAAELASQNNLIPATAHLLEAKLFESAMEDHFDVDKLNNITLNLWRLQHIEASTRRLARTSDGSDGPTGRRRKEVDSSNLGDINAQTTKVPSPATPRSCRRKEAVPAHSAESSALLSNVPRGTFPLEKPAPSSEPTEPVDNPPPTP